ncbi:DNA-directed RNA polymerase subunit omega [Bittarella massiliensis (ex Durand et al. 2017)]|uniref:DNA-directed RNA polymerase subunit omega n=1 Tax=Bittarella massiliensis (ex Durand et al. 2017) TaxID=1720313 RepID=UPI001AA15FC1|nr:DNA-directed RNA polymerase subunit omega [Bittarella massiliensis (ex Durand et al. 2017)]MBO1678423.1 DNA-directed RNA polymerase subunit omega [Bittarella massiliensis (ex Durand et al. 2017)]
MLRPALSELLKPNQSYYMLVVAVAKRAREIVEEAAEEERILVEKPVKLAVMEFANNVCSIREDGKND